MWPDVRWHVPIRRWAGPRHLPLLSSLFADHIFPGQLQVGDPVMELLTNLSMIFKKNFKKTTDEGTTCLSFWIAEQACQIVKDLSLSWFGHLFQYQSRHTFYSAKSLSAASGKSSIFGSHWMQRPVKNGPFYYTRSCAALRAAGLGLSGPDAFVTHKQTEVAHFCDSHRTPADRLK